MATCETCNDTHSMSLRGSLVPCTRCPTPCQECRINGRGAYCAKTPCACACHAIVDRPAPTPTVAPGLDLDAVERAERAMTPGPWRWGDWGATYGLIEGEFRYTLERAPAYPIDACAIRDKHCAVSRILTMTNDGAESEADAAGIVALRNAAPALIAEVRALRRHYDAAGPDHNILALLDLYHEREQAALAKLAEAKRLGLEACEYYADAPDLHDPACASLDQRGACDCTAGIAAALEAL